MPNGEKCSKCKTSLNRPFYRLIIMYVNPVAELYCINCWKQKNHISLTDIVEKYGRDGKMKNYTWHGVNRRWEDENGEVDEDFKESNGNNRQRERERERESKFELRLLN